MQIPLGKLPYIVRGCSASVILTGPGHVCCRWGALTMLESTVNRQTANNLAKLAAVLTEEAFASGQDLTSLSGDLNILKAAADLSRRVARRQEARAAQSDGSAPFCMGCQHRKDVAGRRPRSRVSAPACWKRDRHRGGAREPSRPPGLAPR